MVYTLLQGFLETYEDILGLIANVSIVTLELIGILIVIIGAFKSIILNASKFISKHHRNIKIDLANSLALGLEFKMGAEIIKTVTIHELQELIILAFIIALRAALTVLIHWEIKTEKKEELLKQKVNELKNEEK